MERIQTLPKEIQILIGEYNPIHRIHTREVQQEFFGMIYCLCRSCKSPFNKEFCPIDYFIIRKYHLTCHWCSVDCFHLDKNKEEKIKCLSAVKDYFQEKD